VSHNIDDPWSSVVGQERAVGLLKATLDRPVHAYLLIGGEGVGTMEAALAFAGELLGAGLEGDDLLRTRRLAATASHPSVEVVRRVGAAISRDQIREVVRMAEMAPPEGRVRIIVLTEFHLVNDAAPMLLKTLEEPPASTIFVVLADELTPEMATIASRCFKVEFSGLSPEVLVDSLVSEGVEAAAAQAAANVAGGDLARARLLATDPQIGWRRRRWESVPGRLDGTGAVASEIVTELLGDIDGALEVVDETHALEFATAQATIEHYGGSAGGLKELADRHKRERRRLRQELLTSGVAVLADAYRADVAGPDAKPLGVRGSESLRRFADAGTAIEWWARSQANNPREDLSLLRLLMKLPVVPGTG
jgi:DNA polymerase-3 subunit delta'